MTTLSITEAKTRLPELVREVDGRCERYNITQNGVSKAVLMSVDEFEGWLETLEILSDRKAAKDIRQAREELRRGEYLSFETVVGKAQGK